MIHIPFEQQVKNALTELQKEYPFMYPDYEDVEHYLRQLKNPENLSQMKAIGQNDYPINLYLDFPIHVDQANNLIQDIKDKVEQEKYEEIQENIEILLTEFPQKNK